MFKSKKKAPETGGLHTFRPMPYNTIKLQQNQPIWGHTKPDMLRAEAGGLHT
jgi:hypothetical protein